MRGRIFLLALAGALALSGSISPAQELTRAAFEALRQGGFAVVFRHGKTEDGPAASEDKSPLDLAKCADQAMLTDASRAQARVIGAAFTDAHIPVGKVLASGYCRALEMGRLAFGRAEAADALLLRTYVPIAGAPVPSAWPQRVAALKTMLATVPSDSSNTIVITHFPNIKAALGVDVDFGDAVIVKPDGQRARLVAHVFASDWPALQAAADKN